MTRAVVASLLTLALTGQAHAQRAEAEAAFERGRKLMAAGETGPACAAFETSLRLEHTNGTLYNLGLCHEQLGKLASAWAELKQVSETDTNKARAKDAAKRVAALEARLTRYRIDITEPTQGLVVERDGIDVTALAGQAVPVDPRSYTFVARAPGKQPFTKDVALTAEGETIAVEIPALEDATGETPIAPVAPGGYPRQLALRPVAMPHGLAEVVTSSRVSTSATRFEEVPVLGTVAGRIGLQKFELGLRTSVHVRDAQEAAARPNRWAAVAGSLAYSVRPMLAGRLEYVKLQPVGAAVGRGSDLRVNLAYKQLLAPRIALDSAAGFVFFQRENSSGTTNNELAADGDVGLQLTALPKLSVEARTLLQLNLGGQLLGHTVTLGVGVGALYSVAPQVDVVLATFVGLLPAVSGGSSDDLRTYTLGINWRPR